MTAPTAPELIGAAADLTGMDAPLVSRHWRNLREAGLVSVGRPGRGGHHALVTPRDAATLALSLLVSDSAAQAVEHVKSIDSVAIIIKEFLPNPLVDIFNTSGLIGALAVSYTHLTLPTIYSV